jgi:hypothetical protein
MEAWYLPESEPANSSMYVNNKILKLKRFMSLDLLKAGEVVTPARPMDWSPSQGYPALA